jgi:cytochrome c oxidase accessory protein FixG
VQVCPTGIDIRKGLQYECISCSACIDACDSVMDTMGYPKGLIRYTTQHALDGKPTHVLRPRVFVYAALLAAFASALAWSVLTRLPIALDVIRDRNQLYRETDAGLIENVYTLKVMNMDHVAHEYRLSARGIEDLALKLDHPSVAAGPGEVRNIVARLQSEEDALEARSTPVYFTLTAVGNEHLTVTEEARFLGPAP